MPPPQRTKSRWLPSEPWLNRSRASYAGRVPAPEGVRFETDTVGGILRVVTARNTADGPIPVGAVALSPVTDLTLSRQSWKTRAAADPYFIESQARELIRSYLSGADPMAPKGFGTLWWPGWSAAVPRKCGR